MITPAQIRGARALLTWSRDEVSKRANLAPATVRSAERGAEGQRIATINQLERTFSEAGVEFTGDGGVRLR